MLQALLLWCYQVSRGYIKARTTIKRAVAIPTADILEHFTTSVTGLPTIRAFGAVDNAIEQMHTHLDRLSTANRYFWIFNRWLGLQMSFAGILFSTGTGIILLSAKSTVDTPLVGFALTFSMGFSRAIFQAVNNFAILESHMDATSSIIRYAELSTEDQGGDFAPENWPSKGEISIKNLDVTYSANLPLVLKNISFTIEAGKRLGVVGRTGAGKTSLTLTLLRLLEPQHGCIHIDGTDISTIKLKDLRSRIGFIPQDPVLFAGTIRSNLDYFNVIPEHRLEDALRRVRLLTSEDPEKSENQHTSISGPFTLDTPISANGTNISQGQRQLLCLARVILKKPNIVILDEATSAIDNETDELIQETIREVFEGTLVVVAHRLRSVVGFDKVLVLDGGRIAEFGSPSELVGKGEGGIFWGLVRESGDAEVLMKAFSSKVR